MVNFEGFWDFGSFIFLSCLCTLITNIHYINFLFMGFLSTLIFIGFSFNFHLTVNFNNKNNLNQAFEIDDLETLWNISKNSSNKSFKNQNSTIWYQKFLVWRQAKSKEFVRAKNTDAISFIIGPKPKLLATIYIYGTFFMLQIIN